MDYRILVVVAFLIIIISIQYTLNKILLELKDMRKLLYTLLNNRNR
ncbi:hypothetical protein SAMN02745751_02778 [Dethiosulfatibacter aminovorans DSM 17477]|uniref:Uncharacterized protein n=1 Tax=Dethiosulfatibacter aminovorans DSM 17477 TaxID=1121476 RepID=A0A1M6K214_9FIRM|nr:hypothetical protein SAMN02745751_02778 [Dethiosulfatibacter aminovorans DSM 17477]